MCSAVMVQRPRDVDGCMSSEQHNSEISSFTSKNLTVLFVSLLLDLVAFTVILPLLPSLLDYYGNHDDEVHSGDLSLTMCVCLFVCLCLSVCYTMLMTG